MSEWSKVVSLEGEKLGSLTIKKKKSELQAISTDSIFFIDGNDPYGDISSTNFLFVSNIE